MQSTQRTIPYKYRVKRFLSEQDIETAIQKCRIVHDHKITMARNIRELRTIEREVYHEVEPRLAELEESFSDLLDMLKDAREALKGKPRKSRGRDAELEKVKKIKEGFKPLRDEWYQLAKELLKRFDQELVGPTHERLKAEYKEQHGKTPQSSAASKIRMQAMEEVLQQYPKNSPEARIIRARIDKKKKDQQSYATRTWSPADKEQRSKLEETREQRTSGPTLTHVRHQIEGADNKTSKKAVVIDGEWDRFPRVGSMDYARLIVDVPGITVDELQSQEHPLLRLGPPIVRARIMRNKKTGKFEPEGPDREDPNVWESHERVNSGAKVASKGKCKVYAVAKLNIGTSASPLWVGAEIFMHRPLPTDSVIKTAWLREERVGLDWEWTLNFVCNTAEREYPKPLTDEVMAINLGWRVVGKSDAPAEHLGTCGKAIRVGVGVTDKGNVQQFFMSGNLLDRHKKTDELQGICDRHFNTAKGHIVEARKEGRIPDSLMEETTHVAKWKGHGKLAMFTKRWLEQELKPERVAALWSKWREERLGAGLDLFDSRDTIEAWAKSQRVPATARFVLYLEWWRRKDVHLTRWFRRMEHRLSRRKREYYRNRVAELGRICNVLVFENTNFSQMAKQPKLENDERDEQEIAASKNRHRSSPAGFRQQAEAMLPKAKDVLSKDNLKKGKIPLSGDRVLRVANADVEKTHHGCGGRLKGSGKSEITMQCERCKGFVDQDENRARNMLESYSQLSGTTRARKRGKKKGETAYDKGHAEAAE